MTLQETMRMFFFCYRNRGEKTKQKLKITDHSTEVVADFEAAMLNPPKGGEEGTTLGGEDRDKMDDSTGTRDQKHRFWSFWDVWDSYQRL